MKKLARIIMVVAAALFLYVGPAGAYSINYYDNTINWRGWTPQYTQDQIGQPDVFDPPVYAATVNVVSETDYTLQSVVMHMSGRTGIVDYWLDGGDALSWDALFINTGGYGDNDYQSWDYYVESINSSTSAMYSVGSYEYKLATQPYSGLSGRWGHPAGLQSPSSGQYLTGDGLTPSGLLYSVVYDDVANTLTYTFTTDDPNDPDDQIVLGEGFVIGYSEWCANDVFITPEPGILLLLGIGLLGVGYLKRRIG